MATDFPNSPANGATHTFGGTTYTYSTSVGAWTAGSSAGGASVTVSETAPSSPAEGDLWFDPSVLKTFVYYNDGTANQWVQNNPTGGGGSGSAGASVTASETAPSSPSPDDLWFDTASGTLYFYYADGSSNQWVGVSGPAGATGAAGAAGATGANAVPVTYAGVANLPTSGNTIGSFAYITGTDQLAVAKSTNHWVLFSKDSSTDLPAVTGGGALGTFTAGGTTYNYAKFTSDGTFVVSSSMTNVDILIVAGGGGGAGTGGSGGGGGGAGGLVYASSQSLTAGTYNAVIGAGGALGQNGSNSTFTGQTAAVGGGAGGAFQSAGAAGGSGGGSGRDGGTPTPAAGTANQGYAGGAGGGTSCASAGGGGGAGGVGANGGTDCGSYTSGMSDGGVGASTYSDWLQGASAGEEVGGTWYIAGGGAGAIEGGTAAGRGVGGYGGGGDGSKAMTTTADGTAGSANTGGGGGGGQLRLGTQYAAGTGGSGLILLRWT